MAIKPGTYNMTVQRRSDHKIQLVFKDNNNAAISLVGYTVAAQVWDQPRANKYADFAVTYPSIVTAAHEVFCRGKRGCVLWGRDLKAYYRHLMINPEYCGLREQH